MLPVVLLILIVAFGDERDFGAFVVVMHGVVVVYVDDVRVII